MCKSTEAGRTGEVRKKHGALHPNISESESTRSFWKYEGQVWLKINKYANMKTTYPVSKQFDVNILTRPWLK